MYFAEQWDTKTEKVLDQTMCSDICPCYQTEAYRKEGEEEVRVDAYYQYENIDNQTYIQSKRIFKQEYAQDLISQGYDASDLKPLEWNEVHEESFESFGECLASWEQKAD